MFKANIFPMLLDQDTQDGLVVKALPSGEKVIVDPEITAQRLALAFYGLVNVGAFFGRKSLIVRYFHSVIDLKYSGHHIRGERRWILVGVCTSWNHLPTASNFIDSYLPKNY